MNRATRFILFLTGLLIGSVAHADDPANDLFTQRIVPILNSPNASSCSECHLSGEDLKNYIGDTQQDTFASLNSAGVIAVAKTGTKRARTLHKETPLPASSYMIKIYIDRADQTKTNRDFELGDEQLAGEFPIAGKWPPGYKKPLILKYANRQ